MVGQGNRYALDDDPDRRVVPALKYHPRGVGSGGEPIFAASVADMDFRAPPVVLDALQTRLDHGVFGYEAVPDELLPALTQWLRTRHAWRVAEGHVLRAPNVLNTLATAASLLTESGDGVIVQPPVFFDFFDILSENDRRVVSNPLVLEDGRYRMDFADLERQGSNPRTKLLYLCNPHNPVGRVWTREELTTLGDICARNGVLVVSDEIHADICFSGRSYTPFAALGPDYAANCISCVSPAKSFNIASCCGSFSIVPDDRLRSALQVANSRLTVNKNNAFASVAMEAAYRGGGPWLDQVLRYLETNVALVREVLTDLDRVDLIEPEGTFLLWLDFRKLGLSPDELTAFLRAKAGWVVSRGQAFGAGGAGFARVNIACTRTRLAAALDRLVGAIAGSFA